MHFFARVGLVLAGFALTVVACVPGLKGLDASATTTCADGGVACDTGCVQANTDPSNCGACGVVCPAGAHGTAACASGRCALACDPGFADCDGLSVNGCEVATGSDPNHCGGCATQCSGATHAASACANGTCDITCVGGYADCDHNTANGCETATDTATNCGGCNVVCSTTAPMCSSTGSTSMCSSGCSATQMLCGNTCTDVNSDANHCGSCTNMCQPVANGATSCVAGGCAPMCSTGFGDCNHTASDGCEADLTTDAANCSACGMACAGAPNATPACAGSACTYRCNANAADCNGTASDGCECVGGTNEHGACRLIFRFMAPPIHICSPTCDSGFGDCDSNAANGCETNINCDSANCGACGTVCGSGTHCVSGGCTSSPVFCFIRPPHG